MPTPGLASSGKFLSANLALSNGSLIPEDLEMPDVLSNRRQELQGMNRAGAELPWFRRHPKTALVLVNLGALLMIELVLQLGVGNWITGGESQRILGNEKTHHDYSPGIHFIVEAAGADDFAPVDNQINSHGYRGPEPESTKNRPRILNLGDSFVQADETELKDTFGERLNRHFGQRAEFISHGMVSWSPTPEFSWLYHQGLPLQPDEVNLFLCVNDFFRPGQFYNNDGSYRREAIYNDDGVPTGYRVSSTSSPTSLKGWLKKIELVRLAVAAMNRMRRLSARDELVLLDEAPDEWPADLRKNVDETLEVIHRMNEYLTARQIKLNVLMVPMGFAWPNEVVPGKQTEQYRWAADFVVGQRGIESYLSEHLAEWNISFIDLRSAFDRAKQADPESLLFYQSDGHWNARGHEVVYDVLREHYESRLTK